MQTFLPYESFTESARSLDRLRLGKQRVEAFQILKTLLGESQGWKNHPAVKMWEGSELLLAFYGFCMCEEWRARGYKDTMADRFQAYGKLLTQKQHMRTPSWLGNKEFHASHRSNLLRKDPSHYSQFNWSEPDNIPYYWHDATKV